MGKVLYCEIKKTIEMLQRNIYILKKIIKNSTKPIKTS